MGKQHLENSKDFVNNLILLKQQTKYGHLTLFTKQSGFLPYRHFFVC